MAEWVSFSLQQVFKYHAIMGRKAKTISVLSWNVNTPIPLSQKALNSYSFVLFACICLLGCLFTFFLLPETKGKTLLEISEEFKAITVCGKSFSEEERMESRF